MNVSIISYYGTKGKFSWVTILSHSVGLCYLFIDSMHFALVVPEVYLYTVRMCVICEEIMEQMRRNVASLINKFPTISGSNSTAALPFPGFNGGFPDIDLSKGNTTSVTKVVDGHKVVINETEYKNEDKFGGTFFKVRIIDVKPDSAEITTARDTEDIVDSRENEISKSKEAPPFQEQFDIDNDVTYRTQAVPTKWSDVVPLTQLEDNKLEAGVERIIPIDMSRDTYVNEIMRQRGAPLNPDAEIFEVDNYGKRIGPFD